MVGSPKQDILSALTAWFQTEATIKAVILFGSRARVAGTSAAADVWSDADLHVVTSLSETILQADWARIVPEAGFCLQVLRPATGGVRKLTVLFSEGEADLVLVPASQMRLARLVMRLGLHRRIRRARIGLDEIATCLQPGYRFLKGEREWGEFYGRVAKEMDGVRIRDDEATTLANCFLCDLLWVLQKLERGEVSAAQYLLHRQLADTNFRLLRELRLRRGEPLPSFGIARRIETFLSPEQLASVTVNARLAPDDLRRAAWTSYNGLQSQMRSLVPAWRVPTEMAQLLERSK